MKTEAKKKIEESSNSNVPVVIIDPALEKYKDQVLFPEKLKKANEMLKTARLPELKRRNK